MPRQLAGGYPNHTCGIGEGITRDGRFVPIKAWRIRVFFAVPWNALELTSDARYLVLNVDHEQLKDSVSFRKDNVKRSKKKSRMPARPEPFSGARRMESAPVGRHFRTAAVRIGHFAGTPSTRGPLPGDHGTQRPRRANPTGRPESRAPSEKPPNAKAFAFP